MTGGAADRFALPGLEAAVVGDPRFAAVVRTGANQWSVATLDDPEDRRAVLDASSSPASPSEVLAEVLGERATTGTLLCVELDTCGAWVTVASAGGPRPVVLRRAGWTDLRGHPHPGDDRVGLGPGDAVVLPGPGTADRRAASGERYGDDHLPAVLLRAAGSDAEELAFACWSSAHRFEHVAPGTEAVAVLRVPDDLGDDPAERIAAATGIPADELVLPGYPLGDRQPDLWRCPPSPPREARVLLQPDAAHLVSIRDLLARLLASWRLDPLLEQGDVTLLASELATNAIRHAATEALVAVRYLGDRIRVEVEDSSVLLPERREARVDGTTAGGWGLALLDELASSWGVDRTRRGKRVWFELEIGEGA